MKTQTLRSEEVAKNFGATKTKAYDGPIMITTHGRVEHVLLTLAQYEKLTRKAKDETRN